MPKVELPCLRRGQSGIVCENRASGRMRRRLQDVGLITGTRVECVGRSPLGDPTAYCILDAVIALRAKGARCVLVEV
ncbi:MAG: ferrous iron transport protein A, partial [Clostridiales bacterium]|nr:ferrous iron transport protein A [Clostridiales bacterium]